jgi:hypothetical protein
MWYDADMTKNPFPGLHRKLGPHRAQTVMVEGELVPGSVPILLSMLNAETDPHNRWILYLDIVTECSIADRTAAAVKYAAAQFQEFGDVTALIGYAGALIANKEMGEGLKLARDAVALAIEKQVLINFAAGQYVREAIKTGSVEAVNQALDVLADSVDKPRTEDCRFETDWVDAAEALGADAEMIAWLREVDAARSEKQSPRG